MEEREIGVVNLDKPIIDNTNNEKPTNEKPEQPRHAGIAKTFAIVSFIIGIAGIPLSIITFGIWLFLNIPALIFARISMKVETSKRRFAVKGLKLNIIGIVLDLIMCGVFFLLWILVMTKVLEI